VCIAGYQSDGSREDWEVDPDFALQSDDVQLPHATMLHDSVLDFWNGIESSVALSHYEASALGPLSHCTERDVTCRNSCGHEVRHVSRAQQHSVLSSIKRAKEVMQEFDGYAMENSRVAEEANFADNPQTQARLIAVLARESEPFPPGEKVRAAAANLIVACRDAPVGHVSNRSSSPCSGSICSRSTRSSGYSVRRSRTVDVEL